MNSVQPTKKVRISAVIIIALLSLFAFLQVFPFYLELIRSMQPKAFEPSYGRLYLWPEGFAFSNYTAAFKQGDLGAGYINSLIVSVSYVLLSSAVVLVTGYVFGKKNFPGKRAMFFALLSTMMIPGEVLLVPNYFLINRLGMMDSLTALIFPGIVNIFGIFLVKQYMNSIPDSLTEAARLDGLKEIGIIIRIILPLALPILGTYIILNFVGTWNDYLWPSLVLRTDTLYTLQIKLMVFNPSFSTPWDQTLLAAGLVLTLFPVIIVYLIFQRRLIDSVALSGTKA